MNVLLSNCKQNIMSLSLLAGRIVLCMRMCNNHDKKVIIDFCDFFLILQLKTSDSLINFT